MPPSDPSRSVSPFCRPACRASLAVQLGSFAAMTSRPSSPGQAVCGRRAQAADWIAGSPAYGCVARQFECLNGRAPHKPSPCRLVPSRKQEAPHPLALGTPDLAKPRGAPPRLGYGPSRPAGQPEGDRPAARLGPRIRVGRVPNGRAAAAGGRPWARDWVAGEPGGGLRGSAARHGGETPRVAEHERCAARRAAGPVVTDVWLITNTRVITNTWVITHTRVITVYLAVSGRPPAPAYRARLGCPSRH
jgi:hypothetical protein